MAGVAEDADALRAAWAVLLYVLAVLTSGTWVFWPVYAACFACCWWSGWLFGRWAARRHIARKYPNRTWPY